jgi:hypothetical protein
MKNVWYLSVLVLKLKCKEKMWQIKIKIMLKTRYLKKINGWLRGTSGLSVFLRKTAFKLIFIGDSYSDTSVCPSRGD